MSYLASLLITLLFGVIIGVTGGRLLPKIEESACNSELKFYKEENKKSVGIEYCISQIEQAEVSCLFGSKAKSKEPSP